VVASDVICAAAKVTCAEVVMTLALSERDRDRLSLFVDEMRAMRAERGWSRAELAAQAQYSESLIAMVETYQRGPTQSLAKALDRAFGTPGYTEDAPGRPGTPGTFGRLWRKLRTISFPESFRPYAEIEAKATALRAFEHSLVPGLLQTEDYARHVLSTKSGATEAEIEADVAERLGRQQILTRGEPSPPRLYALLDEGILYRPVAPDPVMHDQLMHLVEVSRWPNVTIQVVPYAAGGHSGLLGAFIIAELPAEQSIVFVEDISGGRVIEDAAGVSEVALRFEALRSEALPKAASRDLIAKVAKERWTS
jgi:transcriptional regulator with XRE-family HTH domain